MEIVTIQWLSPTVERMVWSVQSAIDSQSLTDDVKLTYLKTLVTGKAKTDIAEFAYCGAMYKDALRTLERKFGQPHVVVSLHLNNFSSFPPLKMHNSDNIINYSRCISSLVALIRFGFEECCAFQQCRTEASTQYERVIVTLHSQKALGETYSSGL